MRKQYKQYKKEVAAMEYSRVVIVGGGFAGVTWLSDSVAALRLTLKS